MSSTNGIPAAFWPPLAIIGGFVVIFPLFWCLVMWLISQVGGWHRLARRYAAGNRPVTGECCRIAQGTVGWARYRHTLTLHLNPEGFFMEVMPLFRIGHPRLFIPWSEISGRSQRVLFEWKSERLSIGQPVVTTVTLPAELLERHADH